MDEATVRPRYPRTSAGLRLARQSLSKPVTIDQILDIEDEELDRLRAIEAAARDFLAEHQCLHEAEPPCSMTALRATLSSEVPSDAR